jgi:hypothetical protein
MRECRTYGSVRGVPGNRHPYRDFQQISCNFRPSTKKRKLAGGKDQARNPAPDRRPRILQKASNEKGFSFQR